MVIKFVGVQLLTFNRSPKKGGIASFSADLTKTVAGAMEIADLPDGFTGAKPDIELDCTEFTLKSKEGTLADWSFLVKSQEITAVEIQRFEREGQRNKGFRQRIFFKIKFQDLTGCKALEEFMVHQGETKGQLETTCTKRAKQDSLPLVDPVEDDKQGKLTEAAATH